MKYKAAIVLLAIFFVLYLFVGSLRFDFPDFQDHSKAAERISFGSMLYRDHVSYLNVYHYPPLFLYTLGGIYYLMGVDFMLAKGLLAISNVLVAALIYLIARKVLEEKFALSCLFLFLINPLTFSSVYVGYFDNFVVFFMLLSIYFFLKNKPAPAGAALAAAFMSKPFPLLLFFVFIPYYFERKFIQRLFVYFLLVAGLISAPFLLLSRENFIHYAFLYNFERIPDSLSFYFYFLPQLDTSFIPLIFQAVFVGWLSLRIYKSRKKSVYFLLLSVLFILSGFFVINRINYPHYLIYIVPFFSFILMYEYRSKTRFVGFLTWKHMVLAFGIILFGSILWSYPWTQGISDFKSSVYFWEGSALYFLGSLYFLAILYHSFNTSTYIS
jgi:4-amino-4-deoxy-L-arabinose transferase-like glycosyltransferase